LLKTMPPFLARSGRLFRLISLYYIRRHLLRTVLLLSVLTFGVAYMFVGFAGIPIGERAIARGLDLAAGKAQAVVSPGQGREAEITERDLQTVRGTEGVAIAAPLVRGGGLILNQKELLMIWGVDPAVERAVREYIIAQGDFITQPGQILLTQAYAGEKGYAVGQQLSLAGPGGVFPFTLVGTLEAGGIGSLNGGDLVVLDYADACKLTGNDTISSIAVVPASGQDAGSLIRRLQSGLSDAVEVNPPLGFKRTPTEAVAQILGINLDLIIVMIGALMITGALASSIAQRRAEIGVLRALGMTRAEVRNLFLGESAFIGIIGSLIGVLLGYPVVNAATPWSSTGRLNAPADMTVPGWVAPLVFAAGAGIVILASVVPARQAARLDPVDAILRPRVDAGTARFSRFQVIAGPALLAGAGILRLLVDNTGLAMIMPAVSEMFILVGGCLLFGPLLVALSRRLPPLAGRLFGTPGLLAAESLAKRPRHMISTAVVAFGSLWFFSIGISVDNSTDRFFDRWVEAQNAWDLTATGPGTNANRTLAGIPANIIREITARPAVAAAVGERLAATRYRQQEYILWAIDIEPFRRQGGRLLFEGGDEPAAYARLTDPEHPALLVGGFQALLDGLKQVGRTVTLDTPGGPVAFEIAGVLLFHPEASPAEASPFFVIDRPLYRQLWADDRVDRLLLALAPDADLPAVRRDLLARYAAGGILVADNAELREITDNPGISFKSIAFGLLPFMMLGIANTLFIAVLDRRREIGMLRALGVLRRQIAGSIILEILIVLGAACLAAIPAAYYALDAILYSRITGVPITFEAAALATIVAVTLAAGILAAYIPARQASRIDILDALHYE
jgi:putative ABC transport system permease protein